MAIQLDLNKTNSVMANTNNILFLSHGGGPLPLLEDEKHDEMVACLKDISSNLSKPSAILVISAHWEEEVPTLTSGPQPSLIYDYYGFPEESYQIEYPCPGEAELANKIHCLLEKSGIESKVNEERGFDHGVFIPLKIMYPNADIPCVQLSLKNNLNPAEHIKLGAALRALDYENLLIIGSGFSFHNMKAFFTPETAESNAKNAAFEEWLIDTCANPNIDEVERTKKLVNWEQAPYARYCHPREEHLLPLHVCYGAAGSHCTERFELNILNRKASMYLWRPNG